MPDQVQRKRLIALLMLVSAVTLAVVAALIYFRVVPVPDESRRLVLFVVAAATLADFAVCLWFFREGQSS